MNATAIKNRIVIAILACRSVTGYADARRPASPPRADLPCVLGKSRGENRV
jgi:hypothetical protein